MKRISHSSAADLLRADGARLVLMHLNRGGEPLRVGYFIVPGREIPDDIARALIKRPDVAAEPDGLFPGHAQTWRIIR